MNLDYLLIKSLYDSFTTYKSLTDLGIDIVVDQQERFMDTYEELEFLVGDYIHRFGREDIREVITGLDDFNVEDYR